MIKLNRLLCNRTLPRVAKGLNKKLPALLRIEQVAEPTYLQQAESVRLAKWLSVKPTATLVGYQRSCVYSYSDPIPWSPIRQNASFCDAETTLGTFYNHRSSSLLPDSIIGQPDEYFN
jgi:hypothetical protein